MDLSSASNFSVPIGCVMSCAVMLPSEDYGNVFAEAECPPVFGKRISTSAPLVIVAAVKVASCWSVDVMD